MRRLATVILVGCGVFGTVSLSLGQATHTSGTRLVEQRLQQVLGRWYVVASTFGGPPDTTVPTFVAAPAAMGRAVYSTWRQGAGVTAYEANALWAYDSGSKEIRVFEANSLGVAETHVGAFDGANALALELRSPATGNIVQRRVFRWSGDTLRMGADFVDQGRTTTHHVTLVRR